LGQSAVRRAATNFNRSGSSGSWAHFKGTRGRIGVAPGPKATEFLPTACIGLRCNISVAIFLLN
jgi:hypothetical protein